MNNIVEEIKKGLVEHAWQDDFTINGKNYRVGDEFRGIDFDEFRRGDIVIVSNEAFTTNNGIQEKTRPAVVIQNDSGNRASDNIIVAYLTTQIKREDLPTHVVFTSNNGNRQMFMAEQLQTVKKGYTKRVAKVDKELLEEFDDALITSLGLESYVDKMVKEAIERTKESMEVENHLYRMMMEGEEEKEREEVVGEKDNRETIRRLAEIEREEGVKSVERVSLIGDKGSKLKVKEIVSDNFKYSPIESEVVDEEEVVEKEVGLMIKHNRRSIVVKNKEMLLELIEGLEELVEYL